MSLATKISSRFVRSFSIARTSVDTPLSQSQRTPALPSSAIRPLDARRRQAAELAMPPRSAVVSGPRPSGGAASESVSGSGRGSERNVHPLLDAMRQDSQDFEQITRSLFIDGSSLRAALLSSDLASVDLSRVPPAPGLPGAPKVLLAQALAVATGGDTAMALDGLRALRELDPQREIVDAWRGGDCTAPRQSLSAAGQAAWRVATALAATPSGMDVLQAVLARPVDESHRRDFVLLLKAAAAVPGDVASREGPVAMLETDSAMATLPAEAIACAAARMAGDVEAARQHQWALTAVRNDLYETGPGSDFSAINARLMKMGRWIERAAPDRSRLRNPLLGKSPFRAMRHGMQGVERGSAIARHALARENALREAATALKERLIQLAETARSPGPDRVSRALLRAAVLEHCLHAPAPQPMEHKGFPDLARADIALRLARMLQPSAGSSSAAPEDATQLALRLVQQPEFRDLAKARLDAKTLEAWFAEAREADAGAPDQGTTQEAGWARVVTDGLARAREEAVGRDTRVPRVTRETVRSGLKDIIARIEGSARLRLTSGGISGIGLRQITASISSVASALFVRGRVDARVQRGRQAVFEIAMPPYDMEMVLGTQRQIAGQVGAGAFIGPNLCGVGKAGVNLDTILYGVEKADIQGISLRLPRVGRPVPELREEFSRLVDRVLDGSEGGGQGGEPQPLLKRLMQEFPELTVNRIGAAGDSRRRHGLAGDIAVSGGRWMLKANASAGAFIEAQRNVTKHYRDATGRMRVERSIIGNTTRAGVGVKASVGPTVTALHTTGSAGKTDVSIGAIAAGASAERMLSGAFDRREEVYEDGRLHPLSFVETEYVDVDLFLERLQPRANDWVAAGVDPERLRLLLEQMKQHAMPLHSFAARYIMKPEARARDDVYRSAMQLCRQGKGSAAGAAEAFSRAVEAQWNDLSSMQPYSLRSYERNLKQQTKGIELVVQLASIDATEASHIDNRLDVPARRRSA